MENKFRTFDVFLICYRDFQKHQAATVLLNNMQRDYERFKTNKNEIGQQWILELLKRWVETYWAEDFGTNEQKQLNTVLEQIESNLKNEKALSEHVNRIRYLVDDKKGKICYVY
eukprot:UN33489